MDAATSITGSGIDTSITGSVTATGSSTTGAAMDTATSMTGSGTDTGSSTTGAAFGSSTTATSTFSSTSSLPTQVYSTYATMIAPKPRRALGMCSFRCLS